MYYAKIGLGDIDEEKRLGILINNYVDYNINKDLVYY